MKYRVIAKTKCGTTIKSRLMTESEATTELESTQTGESSELTFRIERVL